MKTEKELIEAIFKAIASARSARQHGRHNTKAIWLRLAFELIAQWKCEFDGGIRHDKI